MYEEDWDRLLMVSAQPLPSPMPIIMEGLNLKIYQNFMGTKVFLTFVRGSTSMGELKLYWGVKYIL